MPPPVSAIISSARAARVRPADPTTPHTTTHRHGDLPHCGHFLDANHRCRRRLAAPAACLAIDRAQRLVGIAGAVIFGLLFGHVQWISILLTAIAGGLLRWAVKRGER